MLDDMPELLTVEEVKSILKISKPVIYRMIKDGTLRAVLVGKQSWRVSKSELLKFIEGV